MSLACSGGAALPAPRSGARGQPRWHRPGAAWLVLPGVAFLLIAFIVPLILLLSQSFYDGSFTFSHYARILTTPSYLSVIWTSVKIAVLSTVITMLLAYPVSCYSDAGRADDEIADDGDDHHPFLDQHSRALLLLDRDPAEAGAR